jgi:hypothetical protein
MRLSIRKRGRQYLFRLQTVSKPAEASIDRQPSERLRLEGKSPPRPVRKTRARHGCCDPMLVERSAADNRMPLLVAPKRTGSNAGSRL